MGRVRNWLSYELLRAKARVIAYALFLVGLIAWPKLWNYAIDFWTMTVDVSIRHTIGLLPYPGNRVAQALLGAIAWVKGWASLMLLSIEPQWRDSAKVMLRILEPGWWLHIASIFLGARWFLIWREYMRERRKERHIRRYEAMLGLGPKRSGPQLPRVEDGPTIFELVDKVRHEKTRQDSS